MVGGTWTESPKVMPESAKKWLSKKAWCSICELSQSLEVFKGLEDDFVSRIDDWYKLYENENP